MIYPEFLKENDLAPDLVNENDPALIEFFGNDCRKIYADVFIDDRNAGGLQFPVVKIKGSDK